MLPLRHLPADRHPAQGSGQLPGPSGHRPGATPGRAHTQLSGFAGGHCGSLRAPPQAWGHTSGAVAGDLGPPRHRPQAAGAQRAQSPGGEASLVSRPRSVSHPNGRWLDASETRRHSEPTAFPGGSSRGPRVSGPERGQNAGFSLHPANRSLAWFTANQPDTQANKQ